MDRGLVRPPGIGVHWAFSADESTAIMNQQNLDFGTRSAMTGEVYNSDPLMCDPIDPVGRQPLKIPQVCFIFRPVKRSPSPTCALP